MVFFRGWSVFFLDGVLGCFGNHIISYREKRTSQGGKQQSEKKPPSHSYHIIAGFKKGTGGHFGLTAQFPRRRGGGDKGGFYLKTFFCDMFVTRVVPFFSRGFFHHLAEAEVEAEGEGRGGERERERET